MLSIQNLKDLWKKEKSAYQTQEIGSGVQLFVKKLLQCSEIFNLREGNLSTKDENRSNEFLEEKAKKSKRADVIIYVDEQIIVPMEIERFGNIEIGEKQLFQYQLVWDKKTGILTDGYEWWFYIGKVPIKKFTLTQILEETTLFLEFWKEYTQPLNYYLGFFRPPTPEGGVKTPITEDDLNNEENRQNFFTDITTLINSFRNKLRLKEYFETSDDKASIEITYAYLIQFILYKTLADNSFGDFKVDFEQRITRIEQNLTSNTYSSILVVTKAISGIVSKNVYRPFKAEQEIINEKLEEILTKPNEELADVTAWLDIFVFIKRYSFANIRNEIFGFIYENYLKQLYDENLGQYFTPPEVTDFMLDELGYLGKELAENSEKDKISIIDPSCGSGTFLYSAVRNIIESQENASLTGVKSREISKKIENLVNENVFGLDVSAFPLYLAEMGIIMRMLPFIIAENYTNPLEKKIKVFKTKDSIAEFLDTAVKNTLYDVQKQQIKSKGQMSLDFSSINLDYKSHIRDADNLKELKQSLENQPNIDRYRFDYVIGNPPYVSYNESSSQKVLFFEFIKEKKVKLSDVYGINLHSIPNSPKKYAPKPNLYAFFISLGLGLLKEGGKLCYIIPQTILTEPDYDVLRYHLSNYCTVEKLIIFKSKMFIGRGLKQNRTVATSSIILVLKKSMPLPTHETEIICYLDSKDTIDECLENIRQNKKTNRFKIPQEKLRTNVRNWNFLKSDADFIDFYDNYQQNTQEFAIYATHKVTEHSFGHRFYFDGGVVLDENLITGTNINNTNEYEIVDNVNTKRFNLSVNHQYYDIEKPIELLQGSQGLTVFKQEYKIIWRKLFAKHFHFSDRKLILQGNNYLGIFSNHKEELFYLFALLNSPITMQIMKGFFMLDDEKYGMFMTLTRIKNFIRVPIITSENQAIKTKLISLSQDLLNLENVKLGDFVDFKNVMMQKFDKIEVQNDFLLLINGENITKCKIKKAKELVANFVEKTEWQVGEISLQILKNQIVIDETRQTEIIEEMNKLVFCLYFNVQMADLQDNRFYQYLENAKK
jgi:hypothetical protein